MEPGPVNASAGSPQKILDDEVNRDDDDQRYANCEKCAPHFEGELLSITHAQPLGLVSKARWLVIASPAAIKQQHHQAHANQYRHHHADRQGDIAMRRHGTVSAYPESDIGEPADSGQHEKQRCEKQDGEPVHGNSSAALGC